MSIVIVDQLIANVSPPEKHWRLVHDGVTILAMFESEGETWTINTLFCATNEAEVLAEISRLGLKPLAGAE